MKLLLLAALFFEIAVVVNGQQVWEQKYDNKVARTFTKTLTNKYILAGSKHGWENEWHIFQTDSMGTIEWDTTYLQGNGYPGCIEPTLDSGFIVAGYTVGSAYFLKFDKNNKLDWESRIKSPEGGIDPINSIVTTSEKGYLATGVVWEGFGELFLIKLDENGDSLWTKRYFQRGGGGVSLVKSPDNTGYYCLAVSSLARTLLLKIDEQGDTIWSRKIHESSFGTSMVLTSDTNLVISSVEKSRNLEFTKVDLTGNIIWEKKYNNVYGYTHCNHISETSDKGFITSNYMYPPDYGELWIMKLDEQGDSLFSIKSSNVKLRPEEIMETSDGFYVFLANDRDYRPRLIKTDKSGSVITSMHSPKLQNQISLYPNPVKDNLTVITDKPLPENGYYRLFNSSGLLIKEGDVYQVTTIDMGNLTKGMYVLDINIEGQVISNKIVK